MHVRKAAAFTPEEIEYLASFPLVTFEKTTGMKDAGSTEKGTWLAAKAIKTVNPRCKILYYRNILVHYAMYGADKELADIPGAFLSDKKGNTKLVRQKVPAYDLSNSMVRKWWLRNAELTCKSKYIDGLFVDGNIKVLEEGYLRRQVGEKKKAEVETAYHRMMKKLPETVGRDKLVIANVIRARFDQAGLEYLDYFDGSYIEGFEHAVGGMSREEYMAKGIAAVQKAARSGRIIAFTIGMGTYADTDMDDENHEVDRKAFASVQDRFTYSLALFLICAEKQSYFMFSDGYGVDRSRGKLWMKDLPEYSRPLGAPKDPAVRSGYSYQRKFEHADVSIDIKNETANINWK
ncbi:putative glycoside hydrolase [Pontiella sulfatireligans]|nr:putative glycoside hydrolase [Pontiella sulfatireligans]